jgi:uncharacterized protein YjbI with pentapeptide repeats
MSDQATPEEPDDSEPLPARQAELRASYEKNVAAGKAPYDGVAVRTRGELTWILSERGWTRDKPLSAAKRRNFQRALFEDANLAGVALRGANVRGARFSRANLHKGDLRDATFDGADFANADLTAALLSREQTSAALFVAMTSRGIMLALLTVVTIFGVVEIVQRRGLFWIFFGFSLPHALHDAGPLPSSALLVVSLLFGIAINAISDASVRKEKRRIQGIEGANFSGACLVGATLSHAELPSAKFAHSNLTYADLCGATLRYAVFTQASFQRTDVSRADLSAAHLDAVSVLPDLILDSHTSLSNVVWADIPITPRTTGTRLVDRVARYRDSSRVYGKVGLALKQQGLFAQASTYRLLTQRAELRASFWSFEYGRWFGSWVLDRVSGYGQLPGRILATYLFVIALFAALYAIVGSSVGPSNLIPGPIDAIVFSVTSFHGRGFFPNENIGLHHPLTILAAAEAVVGLFLELVLIATFSRRFLGD